MNSCHNKGRNDVPIGGFIYKTEHYMYYEFIYKQLKKLDAEEDRFPKK